MFWFALLTLLTLASGFRLTQHCKHFGENGPYSGCVSLTTYDNTTSGQADLYVRYHWYRYGNSNKGWHAFAVGERMAGAHMLIMYGDPNSATQQMTVSVRSAVGNRPPLAINEIERFNGYVVPVVDIVTARFEQYSGQFVSEKSKTKPSHVGVMEAIIYGYDLWPGQAITSLSESQPMIWGSNGQQDFQGDFSPARNIEMHPYGQGFGYLWADFKNAKTPEPLFSPIDELGGTKGTNEIREPDAPTKEELEAGDKFLASVLVNSDPSTPEQAEQNNEDNSEQLNNDTDKEASPEPDDKAPVEQPAKTILGKTLRDWMWHLHGLAMCFSFLCLYPLGIYLLRRPPPSASNGFNNHWTIQSLSTVSLLIGAAIGYINSYSISITHQYVGITMVGLIGVQIFLGWRHHVIYVATKQRTLYSKVHLWAGRFILPLGFWNIVTGMQRREYGWLTKLLVLILMVLEITFLIFVLRNVGNARLDGRSAGGQGTNVALRDAAAEEYFQLAGEDDDEDWSADEGQSQDAGGAAARQESRRTQAERLAKLDKV